MKFRKIWQGSWWWLGKLCEIPRGLLWRGLRHHCPRYNVSCILHLFQWMSLFLLVHGWGLFGQTSYISLVSHWLIHSYISSSIPHTFMRHPVCTKHCSGHYRYNRDNKRDKMPCPQGLTFQWGETHRRKYIQSICEGDKSYIKVIKQGK